MHCCEEMIGRLSDETAVIYVAKFREYGIRVADGGSSFIRLRFCPWCGVQLPGSLRDEWFEALERRGLEPHSEHLPPEFLSDSWWVMRTESDT